MAKIVIRDGITYVNLEESRIKLKAKKKEGPHKDKIIKAIEELLKDTGFERIKNNPPTYGVEHETDPEGEG